VGGIRRFADLLTIEVGADESVMTVRVVGEGPGWNRV